MKKNIFVFLVVTCFFNFILSFSSWGQDTEGSQNAIQIQTNEEKQPVGQTSVPTPYTEGKIPRYDVAITIQGQTGQKGAVAERIAQSQLNGDVWQVNWLSVTTRSRIQAGSQYPTSEVQTQKGILEGPMVGSKVTYFHPKLWPEGYTVMSDVWPLWVDSSYLDLKKNQAEPFSIGFLKVKAQEMQSADANPYQELLYFRNLYDSYAEKASRGKGYDFIKTFDKNFFSLQFIRAERLSVKINGTKHPVPCKILGNRYFELTVLDQYDNPLVLALVFYPERVPSVFQNSFTYLKKNFEFKVSEIQY